MKGYCHHEAVRVAFDCTAVNCRTIKGYLDCLLPSLSITQFSITKFTITQFTITQFTITQLTLQRAKRE